MERTYKPYSQGIFQVHDTVLGAVTTRLFIDPRNSPIY